MKPLLPLLVIFTFILLLQIMKVDGSVNLKVNITSTNNTTSTTTTTSTTSTSNTTSTTTSTTSTTTTTVTSQGGGGGGGGGGGFSITPSQAPKKLEITHSDQVSLNTSQPQKSNETEPSPSTGPITGEFALFSNPSFLTLLPLSILAIITSILRWKMTPDERRLEIINIIKKILGLGSKAEK